MQSYGKTLIKNGTIISMDRRVGDFQKGDILVNGDKIEKIAKSLRSPDAKVINAAGKIADARFPLMLIFIWQTGIRGVAGSWSIPNISTKCMRVSHRATRQTIHISPILSVR